MTYRHVLGGVALLALLGIGNSAWAGKPLALGDKVANTRSLRDLKGSLRPLDGFKDNKALVVAFLGTECPISSLYLPSLLEIEKKYRSKGVQFLAVYPNDGDDLEMIATHSYDHGIPFPVLKDVNQKLADAIGVQRVPGVAVLDAAFKLCYRGRIDDRYGVSFRKQKATRDDLILAIDEVLAGKKVSIAETEADGCLIGRARKRQANQSITYYKHIAGILQNRCQTCHRDGQAAPFSLLTYDEAVRHADMLKEVTTQKRMPPWHADPRYGKFNNDRRMTREEIETLATWVDSGMPKGDPKDAPKPIKWPEGWVHGKPDVIYTMPEEYEVPAEGSLPYQYFTVDPGLTEDKWVKIAEARPGAASVVHHIVVYILAPGQTRPFSEDGGLSVLVGWAPGDLGLNLPNDVALKLPRGSKLMFELHYTPNGKKVKDRSSIGITFAKKPPRFELMMNSFANESIRVPAHDPHYSAHATMRFREDARLISFVPHMHWRGKHYRYELITPDGKRQTLLSVPRWDFNWQNVYQFKEPIKVPRGSRLYAVAHWDNSRNNPYNPDPGKDVMFGLQTWEEMMVGWVAYVWERPETAEKLKKQPIDPAELMFDRMDRNGDDVVTMDEIPERLKPFIKNLGLNLPEKMTRADFKKLWDELSKRFPRQPRRPETEKKDPPTKKD